MYNARTMKGKKAVSLDRLVEVMETLRSPCGCPWDREQTMKSLMPYVIEEAYEVVCAMEGGSYAEIREELGDLLFQIIFISRLAEEKKRFDIHGVVEGAARKMIRRHPHVFGDKKAASVHEATRHWGEAKKKEKKQGASGVLSGVPHGMPSLLRAHKLCEKASKAGFDWKDSSGVMKKLAEETRELRQALRDKDRAHVEEEIGDLFFTLVNVSRFLEVNPEEALRKTIGKFITRFHHVEKTLAEKNIPMEDCRMDELERLWQEAKTKEVKSRNPRG